VSVDAGATDDVEGLIQRLAATCRGRVEPSGDASGFVIVASEAAVGVLRSDPRNRSHRVCARWQVVIENEAGQLITQWNDQMDKETRKKEKEGQWRRKPKDQDEPEIE
jgi:hypothetical protein